MIWYAVTCIQMCRFPLLIVTCKLHLIPLTKTALGAATRRKSRSDCMRQGHAPWFYCSLLWVNMAETLRRLITRSTMKPSTSGENRKRWFQILRQSLSNHTVTLSWQLKHVYWALLSGIKTKSANDLQPHANIIAVHTSFNKPPPPLQTFLIAKVLLEL